MDMNRLELDGIERRFSVEEYARLDNTPKPPVSWQEEKGPPRAASTNAPLRAAIILLKGALLVLALWLFVTAGSRAIGYGCAPAAASWAKPVDLIETREDIIYRFLDAPDAPFFETGLHNKGRAWMRKTIDEVLQRDFATWPLADATPGPQAGGKLDSGGPTDTSSTTPSWRTP